MRVQIKSDWFNAGKTGRTLGRKVFIEQWWTPVKWDDEDDPDWHKTAGLQPEDKPYKWMEKEMSTPTQPTAAELVRGTIKVLSRRKDKASLNRARRTKRDISSMAEYQKLFFPSLVGKICPHCEANLDKRRRTIYG
jgi:hypothetical protein